MELIKHKDHFLALWRFEIGNGESVRFWEDRRINNRALKDVFPRLYSICFDTKNRLNIYLIKFWIMLPSEEPYMGILWNFGTTLKTVVGVWC